MTCRPIRAPRSSAWSRCSRRFRRRSQNRRSTDTHLSSVLYPRVRSSPLSLEYTHGPFRSLARDRRRRRCSSRLAARRSSSRRRRRLRRRVVHRLDVGESRSSSGRPTCRRRSSPRRRPIRASDSRPDCRTPARRSGTCAWSRTRRRRRDSPESPTPTSASPARTSSRATTTASRSGTSRIRARRGSASASSARRRRATSRSIRICSSCRPKRRRRASTAARRRRRRPVSKDRIRGLRIFDITDIDNPKYLANVQTCRGSHTHTVVRRSEATRRTSTSTSRARRAFVRPKSWRAATTTPGTRTTRTSASKSSRFRSRIRSRRRS